MIQNLKGTPMMFPPPPKKKSNLNLNKSLSLPIYRKYKKQLEHVKWCQVDAVSNIQNITFDPSNVLFPQLLDFPASNELVLHPTSLVTPMASPQTWTLSLLWRPRAGCPKISPHDILVTVNSSYLKNCQCKLPSDLSPSVTLKAGGKSATWKVPSLPLEAKTDTLLTEWRIQAQKVGINKPCY